MDQFILELKELCKTYPNGTQALKNVSFSVPRGSFVAVIGLSGSGKSTLLRCVNRLHEPTSGDVVFNNQHMTRLSESQLRHTRRDIGMIFQQFNLVKRRSVLSNVLMGKSGVLSDHFLGGIASRWRKEWIEEAIEALQLVGIADKALVRADGLSGGQQQRVAIARTLMQNPQLLLADEPVASLDPSTSHSVMGYLKNLNENKNITVLCNLHFLSLVREFSTMVVALKKGEVAFIGKPTDITPAWFHDIYGDDAKEVEIH